jgi:hypothetical protein
LPFGENNSTSLFFHQTAFLPFGEKIKKLRIDITYRKNKRIPVSLA